MMTATLTNTFSLKPEETTSGHVPATVARAKRLTDILGALAGLIIASPLIPLIALAIKLDSRGPVLFRQLRVGEARPDVTCLFDMIKFRSMTTDAEKGGAVWATKQDPRVTRVGRFLRKTRLDEIPQLVNVLRGEMSLVGPRPERPGFYHRLEAAIPLYAQRTGGLRPGITGLAQVYQGYDTSIEDVRMKVAYDHSYAASLGQLKTWVAMDALVIWKTLGVVFGARGQ